MKKIGIFCGYYSPHMGGVERYVEKLSSALMKRGYQIVIVTANHDGGKNYYKQGKLTVYRLPIHSLAQSRYPIPKRNEEYKELLRRIEAEELDYVLLNTRFHLTSLIGAKVGRRLGCPVLLIEHGTDHLSVNNRFLDFFGALYEHFLTYRLKKDVDRYYGVSENCNRWLRHFSIQASGVFHNAIEPSDQKQVADYYKDVYGQDETVISFAGRLIKEKGILNLLEAFTNLREDMPELNCRLVVAGNGDLLETIQKDYADPSIDVLGKLDFDHVMALYKRSDIFVYPSLYPEGLPTSILEAGLMGCAVIATPRGGTEEVITDDRHGIIIDGSKESIKAAIQHLVMHPTDRTKLGNAIKRRIEEYFNWDTVAAKVDQEIQSFKVE